MSSSNKCHLCNQNFKSNYLYKKHLESKKHKNKVNTISSMDDEIIKIITNELLRETIEEIESLPELSKNSQFEFTVPECYHGGRVQTVPILFLYALYNRLYEAEHCNADLRDALKQDSKEVRYIDSIKNEININVTFNGSGNRLGQKDFDHCLTIIPDLIAENGGIAPNGPGKHTLDIIHDVEYTGED